MDKEHVAAIAMSLFRSFLIGAAAIITSNGWGLFDSAAHWQMLLDAGFIAVITTGYLYLDPSFKQYGKGSEFVD